MSIVGATLRARRERVRVTMDRVDGRGGEEVGEEREKREEKRNETGPYTSGGDNAWERCCPLLPAAGPAVIMPA